MLQVLVLWDAAGAKLTEYPALLQPVVEKVLIPVAKHLGFRAEWPLNRSAGATRSTPGAAAKTASSISAAAAAAATREEL